MKDFEDGVADAVCVLLGDVSGVQVESVERERVIAGSYRVDGLIRLLSPGGSHTLVIEAKRNGAPSVVRSGIYQLLSYVSRLRQSDEVNGGRHFIPMLVCPYLSPESRAICNEHEVAYLDLFGNARLALDNVYIERAVAEKPRSETRALRSVFSPKAAAVLTQPDTLLKTWRENYRRPAGQSISAYTHLHGRLSFQSTG